MKKYLYIFCTLTGAALMGCTDLDLIPEDTMAPENYFSSEEELRQYTNAYYGMLPGADALNDICADDVIKTSWITKFWETVIRLPKVLGIGTICV